MASRRQQRLGLVLAGAIVVAVVLLLYWQAGVLFPFAVSGVLAYVLYPAVRALERVMPWRTRRPGLSRIVSITLIYSVALTLIAGVLALIAPRIVEESTDFISEFPQLFRSARATLEQWNQQYAARVPEETRQNVEEALAGAGNALINATKDAFFRIFGFVAGALTLIIGLSTAPIFLFYLLKDQESLSGGLYRVFPTLARPHLKNVVSILNDTVGSYIRGQLILGLIVGTVVGVGLFLLRVKFPLLLGVVAAITELVPIIGPWVGGIAGILVTLATSPEKTLWVILLYLGVQLVENSLLVPRIQGRALGLHPIVVMLIIVTGSQLLGLWGVILGPLLVASAKDVIKYFFQEWDNLPVSEGAGEVGTSGQVEQDTRDSQDYEPPEPEN